MPLTPISRCATALAVALLLAPCLAQTAKPEYGIRGDEPPTGSAIRRYVVYGSPIPINRRYSELTDEQKALVAQYYEKLEPGDEPPFPADGLKPIHDAMRKAQAKLLVSGELILVATIDSNGETQEVKTIGSPSPEMTTFAASVLFVTKFKPARCQGRPCKMDYPFRFEFK